MTFKASYDQEIRAFREYVEYLLAKAWEEEENGNNKPIESLLNETFKLSFKGATIELNMGPEEMDALMSALEEIENMYN